MADAAFRLGDRGCGAPPCRNMVRAMKRTMKNPTSQSPTSFLPRRTILTAALTLLPILATALPAGAQSWPDKPIKLLVPFAAGGNIDVNGRLMAARLSETLGQQMVVENRVGGSGIIATEAVAR